MEEREREGEGRVEEWREEGRGRRREGGRKGKEEGGGGEGEGGRGEGGKRREGREREAGRGRERERKEGERGRKGERKGEEGGREQAKPINIRPYTVTCTHTNHIGQMEGYLVCYCMLATQIVPEAGVYNHTHTHVTTHNAHVHTLTKILPSPDIHLHVILSSVNEPLFVHNKQSPCYHWRPAETRNT